jgi:hypothetical protein
MYFFDILFGFITTYFNSTIGEEVWQPKLIALYYLSSDFTIDILSTIPFVDLAEAGGMTSTTGIALLSLLKLLKVLRIRKITVMIRNLNTSLETKTYYKIGQCIL